MQFAAVWIDAVEGDVDLHFGLPEARPKLGDSQLHRAAAGDGETLHLCALTAHGDVLPGAAFTKRLPWNFLHGVHHDPAGAVHFARAKHHVGPSCSLWHLEEIAVDVTGGQRQFLRPMHRLGGVHRFALEHGDRYAKNRAALGVIRIVSNHLGVVHASGERLRMGLDAEAAAAVHQHDMLRMINPRISALEVDAHLERDLLGVVGCLVKRWCDADRRGNGAVGVVRLAQVDAAAALAAVDYHEAQVVILRTLVCLKVFKSLVDLQHAPPLRESLDVWNLLGGVDDRPADAVRRPFLILLFQPGKQQGDAAAGAWRGHRGAVHHHVALQRPIGHGGNRAARCAEVHPKIAVKCWAARRPSVLDGRHGFAQ